ncbi:hypothetical protein EVAR_87596_1 [Eumeta japonica]|uniref:Uncharacterized protein n=1 Tax=Eumeta variegata TaxID=151549 RepID=A0A4C1WLQ7_EUMVA|nr:hypothetical protein EVAR_87596_1 [Eumeta japonica]
MFFEEAIIQERSVFRTTEVPAENFERSINNYTFQLAASDSRDRPRSSLFVIARALSGPGGVFNPTRPRPRPAARLALMDK